MLDSHRDEHGELLYVPNKHTFLVLLEGANRIGDFSMTWWNPCADQLSWIMLLPEESQNVHAPNDPALDHWENSHITVAVPPGSPSFTMSLPQSHTEVIAEAEILFGIYWRTVDPSFDPTISFSNVELLAPVLNWYLSVHFQAWDAGGSSKTVLKSRHEAQHRPQCPDLLRGCWSDVLIHIRRSNSLLLSLMKRYSRCGILWGCRWTDCGKDPCCVYLATLPCELH